jgi:hypothetical protein
MYNMMIVAPCASQTTASQRHRIEIDRLLGWKCPFQNDRGDQLAQLT